MLHFIGLERVRHILATEQQYSHRDVYTHTHTHIGHDSPIRKCVPPFHGNILWAPKERVAITLAKEIRILHGEFLKSGRTRSREKERRFPSAERGAV